MGEKDLEIGVVCMKVFMKVSIDQDRVMDMVQAMEDLLSNNGAG